MATRKRRWDAPPVGMSPETRKMWTRLRSRHACIDGLRVFKNQRSLKTMWQKKVNFYQVDQYLSFVGRNVWAAFNVPGARLYHSKLVRAIREAYPDPTKIKNTAACGARIRAFCLLYTGAINSRTAINPPQNPNNRNP